MEVLQYFAQAAVVICVRMGQNHKREFGCAKLLEALKRARFPRSRVVGVDYPEHSPLLICVLDYLSIAIPYIEHMNTKQLIGLQFVQESKNFAAQLFLVLKIWFACGNARRPDTINFGHGQRKWLANPRWGVAEQG